MRRWRCFLASWCRPEHFFRQPVVGRSDANGGADEVKPGFEVRLNFNEMLAFVRTSGEDKSQFRPVFDDLEPAKIGWRRLAGILIDHAHVFATS